MDRYFVLMLMLTSFFCSSCTKESRLEYDNKANHYEITYHKTYIVISSMIHGALEENDTLYRKDGEYYDISNHQVMLSAKKEYDVLLDSNYLKEHKSYWKHIYKLRNYYWTPDLKEYNQDIFVTEYYLNHGAKDEKIVLKAYYYDKNYHLLKIIKNVNIEYNAENL